MRCDVWLVLCDVSPVMCALWCVPCAVLLCDGRAVVLVLLYAHSEHPAGNTIDDWSFMPDQQHSLAVGLLKKRVECPLLAVPSDGQSTFTFTAKQDSSATGSAV